MTPKTPRVVIHYCTQCRWLLRAAWYGQELLTTFSTVIGELALVPGTGGIFEVWVDEARIWNRKEDGGFPDIVVLKQKVRDLIAPGTPLGHVDRKAEEREAGDLLEDSTQRHGDTES